MKKNYNQPEFVIVEMMPQTIICASGGPATPGVTIIPTPGSGIDGD